MVRSAKAQQHKMGAGAVQVHRVVGMATSRREINERRLREMAEQARLVQEKQEEEQDVVRNKEADVKSA